MTIRSRPDERKSESVVSRDDAIAAYPDEWVLIRVTERDERGWPSRGAVLAHSKDYAKIVSALPAVARGAPTDDASDEYYTFLARPRERSGADFVQTAQDLVAHLNTEFGDKGARRMS